MKYDDKYKIKHNIKKRGQDQEIQRHFTVSQRPQYTCQQIVEHLCQDPAADDHDIRISVYENVIRRIHKCQKGLHKYHEQHSQEQSYDKG